MDYEIVSSPKTDDTGSIVPADFNVICTVDGGCGCLSECANPTKNAGCICKPHNRQCKWCK